MSCISLQQQIILGLFLAFGIFRWLTYFYLVFIERQHLPVTNIVVPKTIFEKIIFLFPTYPVIKKNQMHHR